MKINRLIVAGLASLLLLAGCRSSKHVARTTDADTSATQLHIPQKTTADAVTAKLSLTLKAGSKKISLGGNYRLKRNEVVQMNLNYQVLFVSINIGTLELTPDYVMVIDRYHKRYCKATYAELPSLG